MSTLIRSRTLCEAALEYARWGYPVFPCKERGKPGEAKRPYTSRGFKDASTNLEDIRTWWRQHPHAMIGLPTGAVSGLVVLDVDLHKPGGREALDRLDEFPATVYQSTPRGGKQYFFRHPGVRIPSGTEVFGVGLDFKADGGYVIAAPSVWQDTGQYTWESRSLAEVNLAPMPPLMLPRIPILGKRLNTCCH